MRKSAARPILKRKIGAALGWLCLLALLALIGLGILRSRMIRRGREVDAILKSGGIAHCS